MPTVQNITLHPWNCQWNKDWSSTMVTDIKKKKNTVSLHLFCRSKWKHQSCRAKTDLLLLGFCCLWSWGQARTLLSADPIAFFLGHFSSRVFNTRVREKLVRQRQLAGQVWRLHLCFFLFGRARPSPGQTPGLVAVRQQHHAMAQDTRECACSLLQSSKGRKKHLLPSPASAAEFVRLL